jgi:hypothetical protein
VNPRQRREARSNTAQASDPQLISPGSRPITLVSRLVSLKLRSTNRPVVNFRGGAKC